MSSPCRLTDTLKGLEKRSVELIRIFQQTKIREKIRIRQKADDLINLHQGVSDEKGLKQKPQPSIE